MCRTAVPEPSVEHLFQPGVAEIAAADPFAQFNALFAYGGAAVQHEVAVIEQDLEPNDDNEEALDAALAQFDGHLAGFVVPDGVVEYAEDGALEVALAQLAANHGAEWDFDESDTDSDDYEPPPADAPLRRSTRSTRFTGTFSDDEGDDSDDPDYVPGESEDDDSD